MELIWWKVLLGMNELKWMNLNDCFFYFFFLLLILAFLFAFFFCSRLLLLSFFIRLIVLCDYLKSQSNELDWGCLIKYRLSFRLHTSLYHHILKCQVGSQMIVVATNYKAFSLFTNPNLFPVRHKKSPKTTT